jgi:exonuclease VII small subunit
MLDLSEKLLNMAEARLLDKPDALAPDQAQREMTTALNQAQQRLDVLRQQAGKTSDPDGLRKQIDKAQLRLKQERQQLATMLATSGSPATGKDQLRQLYAYAQQKLDAARARAVTLPNSEEIIKKLDEAQQRLNEAEVRFGIQPASPAD